jgi:hypothetical protein
MNGRWSLAIIFLLSALFLFASADAALIAIDENGNSIGTLGPGFIAPDPGPGGLGAVLTYRLPFIGVQGDVTFGFEPGIVFGGDVIRFNGNGTVIFYSDNVDGFDSLADTPAPPGALYPNLVAIQEVGIEGSNVAFYTPLAGQPGFDLSGPNYQLFSDGPIRIPEPVTLLLLGIGLAVVVSIEKKRVLKKEQ